MKSFDEIKPADLDQVRKEYLELCALVDIKNAELKKSADDLATSNNLLTQMQTTLERTRLEQQEEKKKFEDLNRQSQIEMDARMITFNQRSEDLEKEKECVKAEWEELEEREQSLRDREVQLGVKIADHKKASESLDRLVIELKAKEAAVTFKDSKLNDLRAEVLADKETLKIAKENLGVQQKELQANIAKLDDDRRVLSRQTELHNTAASALVADKKLHEQQIVTLSERETTILSEQNKLQQRIELIESKEANSAAREKQLNLKEAELKSWEADLKIRNAK